MRIRRLSEIDLARFCALVGTEALRPALRRYNTGGGSWSYEPVRRSTADLLRASTPLFGAPLPLVWEQLASQIRRLSTRGVDQIQANLLVGKVLHDYSAKADWTAVKYPMGRLPIGLGEAVCYWSDVVLDDGSGPFIPFFDHRREHGISNSEIRRIVFSMQHHHVRERDPDLAEARLAVVRFPSSFETRTVSLSFSNEVEILSFEELNERVRIVYTEWASVSAEREAEVRKTGTGGSNPFSF